MVIKENGREKEEQGPICLFSILRLSLHIQLQEQMDVRVRAV